MGGQGPILGGFRLVELLDEGGMGQVWRARHTIRDVSAAVKVVPAERLDDVRSEVLLAEVHSAARLSHPHVVALYDAGRVDPVAASASGDTLVAGSPWYAMELVLGGNIGQGGPWVDVRRWLLQLLDALGHAHARGVVHRDLKPSNVLVDGQGDVRLVDFGMAVAADSDASNPLDGGTPTWMAPEQFMAPRALHGPWTDLYAVGLMAWALACGRPAHDARGTWRLMRAHTEQPLPRLDAVIAVPRGLDAWVRRCAAKSPAERYPRAIDAARALLALGEPVGAGAPAGPVVDSETPTVQAVRQAGQPVQVWQPAPAEPVPPDWRGLSSAARPVDAAVLGLGLTRLRELPVVGRGEAQDLLWEALRDAAVGPMVVSLVGDAGVGKSALARWLCREVHALGLGTAAMCVGSPTAPDEASAVLERALGLQGEEHPDELDEVLEGRLGSRIAARVRPVLGTEVSIPATEVAARTVDALRQLAGGRLPVLWVDDAQWGAAGLSLAIELLDRGGPCLVVLTVRRDARDDDPDAADRLSLLQERGPILDLAPLEDDAVEGLLASVGGLEPALRARLVERTGGNPLFTLELVADWADRGVLVAGPRGWALRGDAEAPLPGTLAAVWTDRIDRLLDGAPGHWEDALELAAVLGSVVDGREWSDACDAAGVATPRVLLARLVAEGLAIQEPGTRGLRWRLVHGMLRESLLDRAIQRGAAPRWHGAAAAMLEGQGRRASARRAGHLEQAADSDAAIDAWLRAAMWLREADRPAALRATDRAAELLEAASPDDPRHITVTFARASQLAVMGDMQGAAEMADALVLGGQARHDPLAEGRGWMLTGIVRRQSWDPVGAEQAAVRAVACLEQLDDPQNRLAEAWAEVGFARYARGDAAGAEQAFEASADTAFIDMMGVQAALLRGHCRLARGDVAGAEALLDQAAPEVPAESLLMSNAVRMLRAEIAWARGRFVEARDLLERSIEVTADRFRTPTSTLVGLLIEVQIDLGQLDLASEAVLRWDGPDRGRALEWVGAVAFLAAARGEVDALCRALEQVEADGSGQASPAIARRLERASDRSRSLAPDASARAGRLAAAWWDRCGRPADAGRVRAALWASGLGGDGPVG